MVIVDAQIRGLSAEVVLQTATVKEFFNLCQAADFVSGYIALPPHLQEHAVTLNQQMGRVASSQRELLTGLEKVRGEQIAHPEFAKVVADLERLVGQCDSAISDTYNSPDVLVRLWKSNLELVAQQNSHIDSYLESFWIAMDENCSALLANLADQVSLG